MGLQTADMGTWYQILSKGMENKDLRTLTYLTCSNEPSLLVYYLKFLVSSNTAKKLMTDDERFNIYRLLAKKHAQKDMVLSYILKNYKDIMLR